MVKINIFVLLFCLTLCSCNSQQKCLDQVKAIAYYSNLDKDILRDKIIPCKAKFEYTSVLLNQKSNLIGTINISPYCTLLLENLKYLDLITGYDKKDGILWDEYIFDFISKYEVSYLGSFKSENNQSVLELVCLNSISNEPDFYEKEIFMLINFEEKITSIIKVGSFSNLKPDYFTNLMLNRDGEYFVLYDFSSLNGNLTTLKKDEYLCCQFQIDKKGKIKI